MSLAPGRTHDIEMLLKRRANPRSAEDYRKACQKIDFLIEEGKDPNMHSLRWRLVQAARAGDTLEGDKIAMQIHAYSRYKGKYRHLTDDKLD